MDATQFLSILNRKTTPEDVSLDDLESEILKAPYAANLFVMKALTAHSIQHADFENILQKAAARTLSRSRLKERIEGQVKIDIQWIPSEHTIVTEEAKIDDAVEIQAQENENPAFSEEEPISEELVSIEAPSENPKVIKSKKTEQPSKNNFGFDFVKLADSKGKRNGIAVSSYQLPENLPVKKKKVKKQEDVIIERFLEKPPGFIPPKIDFGNSPTADDLALQSGQLAEEIVTENMAIIYLKQKNYEKALSTFRKLQLKFPEKSAYFAAKIEKLKKK